MIYIDRCLYPFLSPGPQMGRYGQDIGWLIFLSAELRGLPVLIIHPAPNIHVILLWRVGLRLTLAA
jgi:hypothetical protein